MFNHQARRKCGLLTNEEDTIPGPAHSIGAPKMNTLGKRSLEIQILTQGFSDKFQKFRFITAATFSILRFSH